MTNEIQFLLYNMLNAEGKMQVIIKDDTPWYTERAMGQIFGVDIPVICKHLNDIFDEGELDAYSVVSKMETTAADGQKQEATFYSLDAVIAVGYRVSSLKATRFRHWSTEIINEYITKGFTIDDNRLKQEGTSLFGKDYSPELLERVRTMVGNNDSFEDIQDQCEDFAKDIITRICKRAIRKMNSWDVRIGTDDYPSSFKFFDILSVERQSKSYDEISPFLKDAVEGVLDAEYEGLTPQERFFVDNSMGYYEREYDLTPIHMAIDKRFNELLNEHYQTKKISNFEEERL